MALFGKDNIKKSQYYLWYLGWKESNGLYGREFTDPISVELALRRKQDNLPKLTIEVGKKEIKIVQQKEHYDKKGKLKTERIRYPAIPSKDVTFAAQGYPPNDDVVSCIFLGFNPDTNCAVHVHVYRCDSSQTAAILVSHLNQLIEIPENKQRARKIEVELAEQGQVIPVWGTSDGRSTRTSSGSGSSHGRDLEPQRIQPPSGAPLQQQMEDDSGVDPFESLQMELQQKFSIKEDSCPVLLPPKDYDTLHRGHGNLTKAEKIRKALGIDEFGPPGVPAGLFIKGPWEEAVGNAQVRRKRYTQDGYHYEGGEEEENEEDVRYQDGYRYGSQEPKPNYVQPAPAETQRSPYQTTESRENGVRPDETNPKHPFMAYKIRRQASTSPVPPEQDRYHTSPSPPTGGAIQRVLSHHPEIPGLREGAE